MNVLILGVGFFVTAFLLHLIIWRLRHPRNPIKALVFLFGFVYFAGSIFYFKYISASPSQYFHIVLFSISLFIFYLFTYAAIEADSPSLVIIMRISQAGKEGLPKEKVNQNFGDDLLVEPRLKDLVDAKLIDLIGSIHKINNKGRLFIWPFTIYRDYLRLGKGG